MKSLFWYVLSELISLDSDLLEWLSAFELSPPSRSYFWLLMPELELPEPELLLLPEPEWLLLLEFEWE